MKTKILLLATALFCLVSCNNAELDNNAADLGGETSVTPSGEDVYTIEIEGCDPATKGSIAAQNLGIANMSDIYSKTAKAKLKKNGTEVPATYTWSYINDGDKYCTLQSKSGQSTGLTAKAVKSRTNLIHVKATDGVGSAETDVPVIVTDNYDIDWEKPSITLATGETKSNTVMTNHKKGSVTVTCPTNCKIGTSELNLSTGNLTVTTDDNGEAIVYVYYSDATDMTLPLKAAIGSHNATSSIDAKQKIYQIAGRGWEEISPNEDYHPSYPVDAYSYVTMEGNAIPIWAEMHEYDMQYGSTICHSLTIYKIGYRDNSGFFHEFSDYKVYKNSNLTGEIDLYSFGYGRDVLNDSSASNDYFNWDAPYGSEYCSAKVYINVKDEGYEGTYTGICVKYNHLR